jgi:glycosyltransferase involved in cell wall biosynthesis
VLRPLICYTVDKIFMSSTNSQLISFVVPVFNEAEGLSTFHESLKDCLVKSVGAEWEIIYVNDGSRDDTLEKLRTLATNDSAVRVISLSRNFGKEIALAAGIDAAQGEAIITIDADGQHPVGLIPEFLDRWSTGSKVVIGLRTSNQKEGLLKRLGSGLFYKMFNIITGVKLLPGATDFRLIDSSVQAEFKRLSERNRITRGLIDWLGFDRDYIKFKANARASGEAGYSFKKLTKLAVDSFISLSLSPLYIAAYMGAFVLPLSIILGLFMLINAVVGDPFNIHATGSAYAIVLLLFLVGILLVSQGIMGLYLSHIHTESQNRPLYVIDKTKSLRLEKHEE